VGDEANLRVCDQRVNQSPKSRRNSRSSNVLRAQNRARLSPPTIPAIAPKISRDEELVKIASKFGQVVEKLSESGKFHTYPTAFRKPGRSAKTGVKKREIPDGVPPRDASGRGLDTRIRFASDA